MSDFTDFMSESLTESLTEFGESITFRGVEYTANVGQLGYNPEHGTGGESPRKSCTIILPLPDPALATHPQTDERILTTSHGTLVVVSATIDGSSYTILCAEQFQR